MKFQDLFSDYKRIFIFLSIVIGMTMPVLSFDYGITEDEQAHNQHGKRLLEFFLGTSDKAQMSPIDSTGKLQTIAWDDEMNDVSGEMNIYGGTFDLLCAIVNKYFSPLGEYETRHLINSMFGVLLIIFTGLFAQQLGGWRAGVIALLLMALSPRIIGHSMNNPKDIPFAALYVINLHFIFRFVRELPRPRLTTWLPLLIAMPLAADIRISGLLLMVYLVAFVCARWGNLLFEKINMSEIKIFARSLAITFLICIGGYLLISVLWPFAHTNPFTVPLTALSKLSDLEISWDSHDLFEGRWIVRSDIPWYFAPKWLLIGTPLFIPLGLVLSVFLFMKNKPEEPQLPVGQFLMLIFTFLFPVLFVILRGSYLYNDARHLLFVVPPLLVYCALSFENVSRLPLSHLMKRGLIGVIALTLAQPLVWMGRNHPNEVAYFSPMIGGTNGAWKNYETDFWGNAVKQGAEWIHDNIPPGDEKNPVRVRIWYGNFLKGSYYVDKKKGYKAVRAYENSPDWDYYIMQTTAAKNYPDWLLNWPMPGTIHEIKASNTPLCAIIKNPFQVPVFTLASNDSLLLEKSNLPQNISYGEYINLSLKYYGEKKYEDCIAACLLALKQNPSSEIAYNNLCASYNELKEWGKAKAACEKALQIKPDFNLARNNLNWANSELRK